MPRRSVKLTTTALQRTKQVIVSAIPTEHQNCIVKLERIDEREFTEYFEANINEQNTSEIQEVPNNEDEDSTDLKPSLDDFEIKYEDCPENIAIPAPSISTAETLIVREDASISEIEIFKSECQAVNVLSDITNKMSASWHTEPVESPNLMDTSSKNLDTDNSLPVEVENDDPSDTVSEIVSNMQPCIQPETYQIRLNSKTYNNNETQLMETDEDRENDNNTLTDNFETSANIVNNIDPENTDISANSELIDRIKLLDTSMNGIICKDPDSECPLPIKVENAGRGEAISVAIVDVQSKTIDISIKISKKRCETNNVPLPRKAEKVCIQSDVNNMPAIFNCFVRLKRCNETSSLAAETRIESQRIQSAPRKKRVTFAETKASASGTKRKNDPNKDLPPAKKKKRDKKMLYCTMCSYESNNSSNLLMHVRSKHTGERPFKCEHCPKSYFDSRSLAYHMVNHSKESLFSCSNCDYRFDREAALKWHVTRCIGKSSYECYVCHYTNKKKNSFMDHMKFKHFAGVPILFPCKVCGRNFKRKYHLDTHINIHTEEMQFNCSICLQKFEHENEATSHEKQCKRRRFECYICKYTKPRFGHSSALAQHMRTHTGQKSYRCTECLKEFALKRSFDLHMANHTGQQVFRCSNCRLAFFDLQLLENHEIGCNRKHYECYLCKRNMNLSLSELKKHIVRHIRRRPKFKCEFCSKTFLIKTQRKYHIQSFHSSAKNLECKHCKEQFTHVIARMKHENQCIHILTGSDRVPIKCAHCPKLFLFDYQLKAHEMKCLRRIQFQCYLCGTMGNFSKINMHMRSHTGERPAKCPYCPRNFRQTSHLNTHLKRCHNEHVKQPNPNQMFKCSHCDRQFAEIYRQKMHETICKTFECYLCGKSIKSWRRQCLQLHMRSAHTGEKPFKCTKCWRAYCTRLGLVYHNNSCHSKGLPFKCSTCSCRFSKISGLNRHEGKCRKRR